jgi:hypothetical protein
MFLPRNVYCGVCLSRAALIVYGVRYRSGQTGQTVNLLAIAFEGSNPSLTTILYIGLAADALSTIVSSVGSENLQLWCSNWIRFLGGSSGQEVGHFSAVFALFEQKLNDEH